MFWLPFFKGFTTGFVMCWMLGTVFFSLIQNSIQNGYKTGILIASGVVASDIIFITLALFGVSFMPQEGEHSYLIEGLAALILIILGIGLFNSKKKPLYYPETKMGKGIYYFSNGFLLNILNPVNFLAWASLAAFGRSSWNYSTPQLIVFFAAALLAIWLTEVGIAYSAEKIKKFMNDKILSYINIFTGILFIAIALYIVYGLVIYSLK